VALGGFLYVELDLILRASHIITLAKNPLTQLPGFFQDRLLVSLKELFVCVLESALAGTELFILCGLRLDIFGGCCLRRVLLLGTPVVDFDAIRVAKLNTTAIFPDGWVLKYVSRGILGMIYWPSTYSTNCFGVMAQSLINPQQS
jgi:hypothetical protein